MKKHIIVTVLIILGTVLLLSGCTNQGAKTTSEATKLVVSDSPEAKEKKVMDSFYSLIGNNTVRVADIFSFIDSNIALVSQQNAVVMIVSLEEIQKKALPAFQDKFSASYELQRKIAKVQMENSGIDKIDKLQDQEVKTILRETLNSGFKIETAEGEYFPIIDYSVYKKYQSYVTPDIAEYLSIMTVESDKTSVKDAALTIGWDEIVRRAASHERFIQSYSNSAKVQEVRTLLKRYLVFAFYGANNTPLFDYDSKAMKPGAKKAYQEHSLAADNGPFSKLLKDYLKVLEHNSFRLTSEVQEFRKQATEQFDKTE